MLGPAVLPRRRLVRAMLWSFAYVAHLGLVIAICHATLSTDPTLLRPVPPKPAIPIEHAMIPTATKTPSATSTFPTAIPLDARRVINGLRFGGVEVLYVPSAPNGWNTGSHD